ncbi:diacylglycerol O-acyltransferase [Caerostris extrusa]|uniref:Diacylglycerol O-acyltransferase n=1 Tax=Caerostris extrusa TaxID=172846 RepID=A0AAV4X4E7_CAEEX|nr:diacylglycerol O-acyltransferase [Caerostris extrusa]
MEMSDIEDERESPTEQTALETPVIVPQYMKNVPVKKIRHPTERSIVPTVILSTAFVVGGLAFGLPVVVTLTVAVVFVGMVRIAVAFCCASRMGYGFAGCTGLLSATDAFWLHDSHFNCYVAHCLFFVERGLDVRTTREILQSRVIEKTTENGERAFARFTQKVVSASAGYCWVDDSEFDIEKHVFEEAKASEDTPPIERPHIVPHEPPSGSQQTFMGSEDGEELWVCQRYCANCSRPPCSGRWHNLCEDPQQLPGGPSSDVEVEASHWWHHLPLNVFRAAVVAPLTLLTWLCARRDYNPISHRQPCPVRETSGGRRVSGSLSLTESGK